MFKKLKRKMLFLNLAMLTVLLIAVFATLYLTNYRQIQGGITLDLNKLFASYDSHIVVDGPPPGPGVEFLPERNVTFMVVTDSSGNITNTTASFDSNANFYIEALDLVEDSNRIIELDGNVWAFRVETRGDLLLYGFVDITFEQVLLTNMIYTFIGVFLGAFILVYLISNFFSNRSIKQISEAFKKQKQFIADASHEIKTPLSIINTNTDILLEHDKDNKWLNYIKYETDRMNKLTKDLLYLTKMSEQLPNEVLKVRTNMSELVESTILTFEALAYQKELNIKYDIEKNIFLEIDENQFNQVFHILIDNAIKYSPTKGKIQVNLKSFNNQIIYSIKNAGEGIKKEDINNIFDRFYMGDKSRSLNQKSYGLGLSIAKTIIENHNGKIICESIVNESTTFTIKLKR